jgi:hypothetical protein
MQTLRASNQAQPTIAQNIRIGRPYLAFSQFGAAH